jgi:hypothetical protein
MLVLTPTKENMIYRCVTMKGCIAFSFKFVSRLHPNSLLWVARQVISSTVLITGNSFSIFQDKQEEDKALLNKSRTDLKYKYVFV